jgi:hypothetical protein
MQLHPAVERATAELAIVAFAGVLAVVLDAAVGAPPLGRDALDVLFPPLVLVGVVWVAERALEGVRAALPTVGAPPYGAVVDRSLRGALDAPRWWVLALLVGPALALLFDGSAAAFAAVTLGSGIAIARRRALYRRFERAEAVELVTEGEALYATPLASRP